MYDYTISLPNTDEHFVNYRNKTVLYCLFEVIMAENTTGNKAQL